MYTGIVQPAYMGGNPFVRSTGSVWFNMSAKSTTFGADETSDWDCILPVAELAFDIGTTMAGLGVTKLAASGVKMGVKMAIKQGSKYAAKKGSQAALKQAAKRTLWAKAKKKSIELAAKGVNSAAYKTARSGAIQSYKAASKASAKALAKYNKSYAVTGMKKYTNEKLRTAIKVSSLSIAKHYAAKEAGVDKELLLGEVDDPNIMELDMSEVTEDMQKKYTNVCKNLNNATCQNIIAARAKTLWESDKLKKIRETELDNQYAGYEWPFRCDIPEYIITGGPDIGNWGKGKPLKITKINDCGNDM